jgi:hypothetical protein
MVVTRTCALNKHEGQDLSQFQVTSDWTREHGRRSVSGLKATEHYQPPPPLLYFAAVLVPFEGFFRKRKCL